MDSASEVKNDIDLYVVAVFLSFDLLLLARINFNFSLIQNDSNWNWKKEITVIETESNYRNNWKIKISLTES